MTGAVARDQRYDVVVLGTGAARLTAAVRAAAGGAARAAAGRSSQ
jgi:pyruvate/2-oxoglutarate dehydrogenase complex dihydrolipoamide dehydrogenase (E3) component